MPDKFTRIGHATEVIDHYYEVWILNNSEIYRIVSIGSRYSDTREEVTFNKQLLANITTRLNKEGFEIKNDRTV